MLHSLLSPGRSSNCPGRTCENSEGEGRCCLSGHAAGSSHQFSRQPYFSVQINILIPKIYTFNSLPCLSYVPWVAFNTQSCLISDQKLPQLLSHYSLSCFPLQVSSSGLLLLCFNCLFSLHLAPAFNPKLSLSCV